MRSSTAAMLVLGAAVSALVGAAAYSRTIDRQVVRHDQPGQALTHRALSLRDEDGRIAPRGLLAAKAKVAAMKAEKARRRAADRGPRRPDIDVDSTTTTATAPGTPLAAGTGGTAWTSIGPGNVGGRVRSLAIHPWDHRIMFAGSVSGGIWRTQDSGASWAPVDDFMANLGITAIVIHPTNPQLMFAATGEGFGQYHPIPGAGIFVSTDAGTSWTQLPATDRLEFTYVLDLVISPDGGVLLAATRNDGVYRSANGGATWQRAVGPPAPVDLEFHPTDSSRAIAGDRFGRSWHSRDGGASWAMANLPSQASRTEVAYAASSPETVYAVVDVAGGIVYRSTDGGVTFGKVYPQVPSPALLSQGWYNLALWINPIDPGDLIIGGVDLSRSRDGGQTFTLISSSRLSPEMIHVDHHAIVSHPLFDGSSNQRLFFTNDGGVWTADLNTLNSEATARYQELNNGLAVTQFYGAAGNAQSGTIIGGTQDNGTVRATAGAGIDDWTRMFGGDGGFAAADHLNPAYLYGEHTYLTIHRSSNGGASADFIYYGISDAGRADRANFIAPFILDPNDPRRLLAGGMRLWRTADARAPQPQWQAIKPVAGTAGYEQPISAIAVAPGHPDVIWVGHNDGDIFRTANGTASAVAWTKVMTPFRRFVTRISIDPADPSTVYVSLGGFQDGNIQRTTDGGETWTDVTGDGATGLPLAPVRDVEVHPADSRQLFAATEVGVFHSMDGGATWDVEDKGPANVSVDELIVVGQALVAATYGRGLFTRPLPAPQGNSGPGSTGGDIVLYAADASVISGGWRRQASSSAAGGTLLRHPDAGAAKRSAPEAHPVDYFELTFDAPANTPYHLWLRGRADNDHWANDSLYVQFSDVADHRIGTTSAHSVVLEDCSGCGLAGWAWQDNGWAGLGPHIVFTTSGRHTIRIQSREDGVSVDQVVLSPATYLTRSPGAVKNDTTVLAKSTAGSSSPPPDPEPPPAAAEIVLYAADATVVNGGWRREALSTAAGGALLRHPDAGAAKRTAPAASPVDYFELTFDAPAGVPYHLWLRGRADNDHWGNDSLYVQFSDSTEHRIGTTTAFDVVLEDCTGCGVSGWGWQDNGWGAGVLGRHITFTTNGPHTIRIQTREDGMSVDQIVLSPTAYLSRSPGTLKNDTTILGRSSVPTPAAGGEIVLHATDAATVSGGWRIEAAASAAGGSMLRHPDAGAAKRSAPEAQPVDYIEFSFDAPANTPYHVWLRGRADNDHWANDSVYVQFSDSTEGRIGTASAYNVVLEDCSGCGLAGWGWQDNGWNGMGANVIFTTTGRHTIRIQTREDGVSIDQVVLSPAAYLSRSPGAVKNDATILPRSPGR